ncbi:MAG TPA: SRPBCC family protein [Candidatus Acidoferrales bacterium]|nr:SRPBCC family protein [Candidatus Acidoferrales bacterium]
MLMTILISLAVIVVLLLILVATRPSDFRVTRSNAIAAPAEMIFAQVNDLHKWEAWSPWEKMDPALKKTFTGPPAGTGASYSWAGNNKVGTGRMTIMESHPGERIRIKLEFLKPFKATNTAEFMFKPEGAQTAVTWSMSGKNNFMGKAMGLVMNFDKMIGGQFEKGLAQIKLLAETTAGR